MDRGVGMKRRVTFVSNSSSASFVVTFQSFLDEDLVEVLLKEAGVVETKHRKGSDVWEFSSDTYMFNDWLDAPGWKFVRALVFGVFPSTTLKNLSYESENLIENDPSFGYEASTQGVPLDVIDFRSYPIQKITGAALSVQDESRVVKYEREYFEFLKKVYASV